MIQMNYWLLNPYYETFITIWKMNKKMNIDNFQNFGFVNHKLKFLIYKIIKWVIFKLKMKNTIKHFPYIWKEKIWWIFVNKRKTFNNHVIIFH
jgi:hypothetical protein